MGGVGLCEVFLAMRLRGSRSKQDKIEDPTHPTKCASLADL